MKGSFSPAAAKARMKIVGDDTPISSGPTTSSRTARDGRKVRTLNVIDEFTWECIAIKVEGKLKAVDAIDVPSDLFIMGSGQGSQAGTGASGRMICSLRSSSQKAFGMPTFIDSILASTCPGTRAPGTIAETIEGAAAN